MIKLGDKVKDRISGMTGIVIGHHQWLYGCARLTIQPQKLKDGRPIDSICIDEPQCELLKSTAIEVKEALRVTGGPRDSAAERSNR